MSKNEPNAVNEMKNWAALVEKEQLMSEMWRGNWGEVFFENGAPSNEDKIAELEKKAQDLSDKMKHLDKKAAELPLESFKCEHFKQKSKDLMPSWPFGNQ